MNSSTSTSSSSASTSTTVLPGGGSSSANDADAADATDTFAALAADAGESAHAAAAGATAWGGRGLFATRGLCNGDVVVAVPTASALIICDAPLDGLSAYSDARLRDWQEAHGALPPPLVDFVTGDARWDARMAAWLLWLHSRWRSGGGGGGGSGSSSLPRLWRRYLALLPPEPECCTLLNFSEQEAAQLQVPALVAEAEVQRTWCRYLHSAFFDARSGALARQRLSDGVATSLWALGMVRSRTFSEDVAGEALTLMAPFCDLANHAANDRHNATFCLSRDAARFTLRAVDGIPCGAEVLISYGADKPNHQLLRDYGFVVPGNEHDRVAFFPAAGDGGDDDDEEEEEDGNGGGARRAGKPRSKQRGPPPVRLNPLALLAASGFEGDLASGDVRPCSCSAATAATRQEEGEEQEEEQRLRWARRRAALLSVPLDLPSARIADAAAEGGLSGWLSSAAQAWTPAGEPDPEPLRPEQVPAERRGVAELRQRVRAQLAELPTSAASDAAALLQQQQQPAASGGGAAALLSPRGATAVRARLEHKLLMHEADALLAAYERHLAAG